MAGWEAMLRQQLDLMRALLDNSVDGIVAFDLDYRFTHWNAAVERFTGVTREQAIGQQAFELFPYLLEDGGTRLYTDLLQGRAFERVAREVRLPGQEQIQQLELNGSPLYDANGTVYGGVLVVHDVTARKRAEAGLQEANKRALDILESITDAFFALDQEWRFSYVNKHAARLLSRKPEDLIGRVVWEEFPEAVELPFYHYYRQAESERVAVYFDAWYPPLETWFDVRAYPSENGLSVYFRDITERKRKADEKDQHYRSLVDQNPDAVFSFDMDGNFLSYNALVESLTGYRGEDLVNRSFIPLVAPKDVERTMHHFERAKQGIPQTYEATVLGRDGRRIEVQVTNIPIVVDNQVVGVYGIAKDITERKRMEEELRSTKERLESFVQNNADAIWVVDMEEVVQSCNPSFARIFGWEKAELIGKKLPIIPPFLQEEIDQLHRRVKAGESVTGYETLRLRKDGSLIDVSANLSPICDKEGNVIGMTGVCRDISDSKRTEELLLKSEKLAVAGQLAAGVAHEIRNPLTALKGFVQLMQVGESANPKYLDVMGSELSRIELIISELLVLAKPQAVTFKPKDVLVILEDVITISETQAILNNVQIVREFEPNLPLLDCDENQLKQVFINFIKNGIEAMRDGGRITVVVKREGPDDVLIRFSDEGCGIPKEILSRIGEPFYTTKEKGTGLGLMVSHKIIEHHNGKLLFTSELNVGTTIDVILPIRNIAEANAL